MADQWVCPNCGHINSGKVSGVQSGGSFELLAKNMEAETRVCSNCKKPRSYVGEPDRPGIGEFIGGFLTCVVIVAVIVFVLVLIFIGFKFISGLFR